MDLQEELFRIVNAMEREGAAPEVEETIQEIIGNPDESSAGASVWDLNPQIIRPLTPPGSELPEDFLSMDDTPEIINLCSLEASPSRATSYSRNSPPAPFHSTSGSEVLTPTDDILELLDRACLTSCSVGLFQNNGEPVRPGAEVSPEPRPSTSYDCDDDDDHDEAHPVNTKKKKRGRGESQDNDGPYIKKPDNSFMIFMKERRPSVPAEVKKKGMAASNKYLANIWNSMTAEQKSVYYRRAEAEALAHRQKYPDWCNSHNYAMKKRVRRRMDAVQPPAVQPPLVQPPLVQPPAVQPTVRHVLNVPQQAYQVVTLGTGEQLLFLQVMDPVTGRPGILPVEVLGTFFPPQPGAPQPVSPQPASPQPVSPQPVTQDGTEEQMSQPGELPQED
ncbi:transcription factor SOX-18-like [Cheilinus undulatus]|uniref:transcription factor SOX-18-like n=1 Tax=Cheilinus undulatus TaxID=241271 RepID=UPI001BD35617|nr:transcription factor SOX-18-like [Cheilinus undulatus]